MTDEAPKRRGRPPIDPSERKDGNLTFRTRGDLRQRLDVEAKKNGRTADKYQTLPAVVPSRQATPPR